MAYTEIDREKKKIRFFYPTNKPVKRIKELQEELKGYDIEIIPQNTITDVQMKLCYILFDQFANSKGWDLDYTKNYFKALFGTVYEISNFSLSPMKKNALTLEQATNFIQFIIEFAIEQDVNLYILDSKDKRARHIREIVPNIQRYVISCLQKRICCVCGRTHNEYNTVDLEHYDNVNEIGGYEFDTGLETRFLSLCRHHHTEIHNIPKQEFLEKYHLEPVYLNERLVYKLLEVYPNHFKLFRKRLKEGYYRGIIKEEK